MLDRRQHTRPHTWGSVCGVVDRLGITYRQIDYWVRQGYIDIGGSGNGSGSRRMFTRDDLDRLAVIATLSRVVGQGIDGTLIEAAWRAFEVSPPRYWSTAFVHRDRDGVWYVRDRMCPELAPAAIAIDVIAAMRSLDRAMP